MRVIQFENLLTLDAVSYSFLPLHSSPSRLGPLHRAADCWCSSFPGCRPGPRNKERNVPSCTQPIILFVQARSRVTIIRSRFVKRGSVPGNTWRSPPVHTFFPSWMSCQHQAWKIKRHTWRDPQPPSAVAELSGWTAADTLLANTFPEMSDDWGFKPATFPDSSEHCLSCSGHPLPVLRPPVPSPGLPREEPVPETSLVLLFLHIYILIFSCFKKKN